MNMRTKVKRNRVVYADADTDVAVIGNGFVEFSRTTRRVTLVRFGDDHYKKFIPIGADADYIDLPNGTIIDQFSNI